MVDNMGSLLLHFTLLTLLFPYPSNSDVTTPDASLQEHVKKLDEMLAEMKSHSQAQEQKNSAVLSSVLSKLTQTIEEFEVMKTCHNDTILKKDEELSELWASHNATLLKQEEKDAELSRLWASHNSTVSELRELHAKHNNVVMEFEETRSKLENMQMQPFLNGNVGFHVRLTTGHKISGNKPITFNKIVYVKGASFENDTEAYDKSTGKYHIPINGTYLVWIDFTFQNEKNVVFLIKTKNGLLEKAYGSKLDAHGTASTIGLHYLHQGEAIWVAPTEDVVLDHLYCNFGTVLLNAH